MFVPALVQVAGVLYPKKKIVLISLNYITALIEYQAKFCLLAWTYNICRSKDSLTKLVEEKVNVNEY